MPLFVGSKAAAISIYAHLLSFDAGNARAGASPTATGQRRQAKWTQQSARLAAATVLTLSVSLRPCCRREAARFRCVNSGVTCGAEGCKVGRKRAAVGLLYGRGIAHAHRTLGNEVGMRHRLRGSSLCSLCAGPACEERLVSDDPWATSAQAGPARPRLNHEFYAVQVACCVLLCLCGVCAVRAGAI